MVVKLLPKPERRTIPADQDHQVAKMPSGCGTKAAYDLIQDRLEEVADEETVWADETEVSEQGIMNCYSPIKT